MARPIDFDGADHIEDADPPQPNIGPLPVRRLENANVSCWKLDAEELEEINRTGVVWLFTQTMGQLKPPPEGERWQPILRLDAREDVAERWSHLRNTQSRD